LLASAGGFDVGLAPVPWCLCSGIVFLSHFAWSRGEKDSGAGCVILSLAELADATYVVLVFLFASVTKKKQFFVKCSRD
jgi:hypothetical protein